MSAHRHLEEADLLRLALEGRAASRSELAACPTCAARLGELDRLLETCRAAARERDAQPARARHLAERVLAATTRADPTWRGDVRLLGGFLGGRLRSSRVLRFAAASLVAHLVALPVFAWLAFREPPPERHFQTGIEHREPRLPDGPMEPERTPRFVDPEPDPRLIEADLRTDAERRSDAAVVRRAQRTWLRASPPPPGGPEAPADPLARLLWARARILRGQSPPPAETTPGRGAGALELSIAAEALLDHRVLSGERTAELDVVLARLAHADSAADRPERVLRALALARASSAGVLRAPDERAVQSLLASLDLPTHPAPEAWARELQEAVRGRGRASEAAGAAWSGWGR